MTGQRVKRHVERDYDTPESVTVTIPSVTADALDDFSEYPHEGWVDPLDDA